MHTTKLKVQDFQTEGQTRKILAKVKKGWRVAKNCTNVPYANTPRTLSLELMRAGQWDLAIDWVINLNDEHVTGSLKFRQIAYTTDQPFMWFLLYSTNLKDEEYWEGLFIAANLEEDFYAIPVPWWNRAFNNETNAGKYDVVPEEKWLALLQSHPQHI